MTKRKKRSRIGLTYPPLPTTPLPGLRDDALRTWNRLAPLLADAGTHTIADVPLLEEYCRLEAELRTYDAFRDAIVRGRKRGAERTIQLGIAQIHHRLLKDFLRLGDRLGLSPLSRRKIERHLGMDA